MKQMKPIIPISEHVTYDDATSCVCPGIVNFPNTFAKQNMIRLANQVFEPLYECFGDSIVVLGMFRTRDYCVKSKIRVPNEYMLGESMEITARTESDLKNSELFAHMFHWVPYHQLIWCTPFPEKVACTDPEPAWIRVTLKKVGNHHIALREYWDNGVKLVKRVVR